MPMVGGKKFPYTKKGVAAAKKVAAEKREAMQKKNRAAAGKSAQLSNSMSKAYQRLRPIDGKGWAGESVGRNNRVKSTAIRGDANGWYSGVEASDSLRKGAYEKSEYVKKKASKGASAVRAKARRAGAR